MAGSHAGLLGDATENLILKAHRELKTRIPGLRGGVFSLHKNLPVAAGLGGGSSDAAAALRLLARLNELTLDDPRLREAGEAIGSDVPVCIERKARIMRGRGENLGPAMVLPPLPAVLVNPRLALSTPAVFGKLGLRPGESVAGGHASELPSGADYAAALSYLAGAANDLEPPAIGLAPAIEEVIDALTATEGADLVRMSGSGATVFALYGSEAAAAAATGRMAAEHAGWWVTTTMLR
ncbi:4-diphosphocytidyl-2-C-methyl-D-erythritol kinase [Agaricicola taiwanensis]|uniref:4-diphosphocytidyl-2-C-methyl-D-erythritol kinase n=1 Tax=Agaricicola taiwanensis TaxID=591372 RepID=A0A8J2VP09_9RHOB|nr:4-diphosphocytidyl-2-C-methyl-D-erythritol kinase [Agaricicola taiwanensis]